MKVINLPPFAPTLIESTRAIGYSLESAIADIVDNSIAANATLVKISFFPIDEYIAILDNGTGMSADELTTAMQYGSKNPLENRSEQDLGRFGLGLKTASLSQCRNLTVASIKDNKLSVRRWDIDYVKTSGEWSLLDINDENEMEKIPGVDALQYQQCGTLVVWQKLDRLKSGEIDFEKSMSRMFENVRNHLELVFHRYLTGEPGINKISITINGSELIAKDPFLVKKSNRPMDDEVLMVHGSKILVRPYILPHFSALTQKELDELGGEEGLRRLQGFYVYRNKRLLVWGTWFNMQRKSELSKLARIQVDIPNTLDELWTLDIKKSSAIPPAEVRANLQNVIVKIADSSKRKYTVRGKKEVSDKTVHIWNRMKARGGGYYYEINREYPPIAKILKSDSTYRNTVEAILHQIEIGLPLNQLYIDLSNDTYIENEKEVSEQELLNGLRAMIPADNSPERKVEFINMMADIEPFSGHPEVIEKLRKEILR